MNDFISRESAVKAITEYKVKIESENMPEITKCCFQMLNITCDKNIGFINSIPAADVQPVKRGKWIATGRKNVYGGKEIECSECHFRVMVSPEHFENLSEYEAFCCHCGVKMEEE